MKIIKRTNMCGELRSSNIGQEVKLNGWIAKARNLGGLVFADLRDRTGIVQITFNDDASDELRQKAMELKSEFSVGVIGTVVERASKNRELDTGDIEVVVKELVIYSKSLTPPIYVRDDDNVDDSLRLKYRYLDLRKLQMQNNLRLRHKIAFCARQYFNEEGFLEIETPMLIKPTPEGARDYLVPSRVKQGSFYSLPQSPQMFKQLLMVSGCDRYMQIVKCFRDEDLRADRQPEFTQIDLEMSYVDREDVLQIQEGFIKKLFKETKGIDIKTPLPRLTYKQAMEEYGSDKPDLRFDMKLKTINHLVEKSEFKVFSQVVENGGKVVGINVTEGDAHFSRKDIDKLTAYVKTYGLNGLVWIRNGDELKSSVNKFFNEKELKEILEYCDSKKGDLLLIGADSSKVVLEAMGFLRRHVAELMGILSDEEFNLLWVVDFPLFEEDEEGRVKAMHHPFTSPKVEDIDLLDTRPLDVRAEAYDIVLNGVEIGGGSIRIHDSSLQKKMFECLGLSDKECNDKFGFLIEAFKYGAPPHGGIAYGLDRLVMLIAGEKSIREVIAFPKNQNAQCLVCGAPDIASDDMLEELAITVNDKVEN